MEISKVHTARTIGEKSADRITQVIGSWYFILVFFIFLGAWISLNLYGISKSWDPYPFILLNLTLSCIAALHAPIILMSQNRQSQIDRRKAEYDYEIDKKAEKEIREIKKDIALIKQKIMGQK